MKNIDESYVIKKYSEGHSTISLAKELETYPKKIERILKKNGQPLRIRSESQSLAIKNGRAKHPTKGRQRNEDEKLKISLGVEKRQIFHAFMYKRISKVRFIPIIP